jgi:cytochrome c oxidase subunit 3
MAPTIDIGIIWPPKGILPLAVYSVPLLNTVILLTRGITVT